MSWHGSVVGDLTFVGLLLIIILVGLLWRSGYSESAQVVRDAAEEVQLVSEEAHQAIAELERNAQRALQQFELEMQRAENLGRLPDTRR